jgi:hypothetical protein
MLLVAPKTSASYNIIGELTSLTDPTGVSLHATTTAHQALHSAQPGHRVTQESPAGPVG